MNSIENNNEKFQQNFSPEAKNQNLVENPDLQMSEEIPFNAQAQGEYQKILPMGLEFEVQAVGNLIKNGFISSQQGLNLLCERVVNFNRMQENAKKKYNFVDNEFLKKPEYKCVLDYLKSTNADFDEGEISQITDMVKNLEKQAIERYLTGQDYKQKQNAENAIVKQKLSNSARKESAEFSGPVFTREMIGKMNSTEFVKNEKAIMEQLRKGLIR